MINVTYAITVCNELVEITNLINFLHPRLKKDDEILIQYDSDAVTSQVKDYLTILTQLHQNVRSIGFSLNKDKVSGGHHNAAIGVGVPFLFLYRIHAGLQIHIDI